LNYAVQILEKELERLEKVKSPNFEFAQTVQKRIEQLRIAIYTLCEEGTR